MDKLSCHEVEELLPLVAEGLIDADTDAPVFEHLAECDHCQDALCMHDQITLSLSDNDQAPTTQRAEVIQFQLPRSLSTAAAILLVVVAGIVGKISLQEDPAQQLDQLVIQEPETQVLEVLTPASGDGPLYIIRHQDQTLIYRQDQIDNGSNSQQIDASIPVNIRY